MIIAKVIQDNLELTIQEINIPYQHSQGLEIEFVRDAKYKDYTLLAFYKLEGDVEAKLMECNNDIISIAKDVFKKIGKVSFSFSLTRGEDVIHLGVVGFYVRRAFGDNDSILPQEDKNTWIDLISNVAKDGVDNYWNVFYKEEIENIVNDINSKVSAASNYADKANAAKTEASKSATNAGNSASNALDSANKAQQRLNSVVEKTNAFNADYTNKVNNFNTSVENANNTLDAKVTVATEQANIATTKATELSQAVDKVKYLEDVVDTKLTQPYVSSPVIENGTISDSDEGLLRNLKIYGKCTQKVETDIVPTPDRPVPIVSKKIVVGGETVELRSLKESVNLFDLGLLSKTELIPKVGAYRKIDIPLILKSNTKYTFTYDVWEVPALSWVVLNITNADADGRVLAGIFNINNTSTEPRVINKNKHLFTTDSTGQICFSYYANGGDNPYVNLWFTKLLKNITLVEGTILPSAYVAPTTRDYKIVDQVSKRSWIERNVIQKNLADLNPLKVEHTKFIATYVYTTRPEGKESSWNNIFCNNFAIYPYNGFPTDIKEGIHVSQYGIYVVLDDKRNVTTIEEYKEWIKDNPIIVNYQLATPITEEISYLEPDTSEFGVSSQDTTCPSPSVPSEVKFVEEIEVKTCGKNLLNEELLKNPDNYIKNETNLGFWKFKVLVPKGVSITVSRKDTSELQSYLAADYSVSWNTKVELKWLNHETSGYRNRVTLSAINNRGEVYLYFSGVFNKIEQLLELVGYLQVEVGDAATEYEPYKSTVISHELENPLLSLTDRSVKDVITLKNRLNLLSIHTFTGTERFDGDYQSQAGYYGRYFQMPNARGNIAQKVSCNALSFASGSWSLAQESCCQNANQLHLKFSNLRLGIKDDTPIAEKREAFNNYIKEQYDNGTPIEFLYILENPIIETTELSLAEKLKTLMSSYPVTHIFSNAPLEFDYKLNMPAWHKVVSGQVEDARDVIYNMQVQQNNLEVMQLESALETQYNMDLLKLGGM